MILQFNGGQARWPAPTILLAILICLPVSSVAFESIQLKRNLPAPAGLKASAFAGVAVNDTGHLWVADRATHQLHHYSPDGEFLESVGRKGTGPGELQTPHGLAINAEGLLYVADSDNQRISIFSADGHFQEAFGQKGSGPGDFHTPWLVAVSRDGTVLVSEKNGERVQFFSRDGVFLHAIDVGSPIDGLTVDTAGRVYTAHRKLKQIEQWSSAGQLLRTYTGVEPGMKGFADPQNLAVSPSGQLYMADPDNKQLRELDLKGHTLGTFGRSGEGDGQFRALEGIAVHHNTLYVADSKNKRVSVFAMSYQTPTPALAPVPVARLQVSRQPGLPIDVDHVAWNPDGSLHALSSARGVIITYDLNAKTTTQIDLKGELQIKSASGLTTAPSSGALFISDKGADRVVKIDKQGKPLLEFGKSASMFKNGTGELANPQGLVCSPQGVLFVVDGGHSTFQAFNHQALYQFSGGEKGGGTGQLKSPIGIAWDKDRIYVADSENKKVATFNTSGRFIRDVGSLGPETLRQPRQVAVDREGNLFVLDAELGRILAYDPQGIYIGGFGTSGKAPGTFNKPRDFALNENGDLMVAEEGRVQAFRVVLLPPAPSGLSATAGEGFVTLKWEPIQSRYPAKYAVFRSTPLGESRLIKETVDTTWTDDAIPAESTFTYTVTAQSVQGAMSVPSAPVQTMAKPMVSGPRLEIVSAQIDDIFSAQYKYYSQVPVGRVVVRNNGAVPVQKLKVTFAIQGYMDFPTETSIPDLRSQEEKEFPLFATLNNKILDVSETTPIQAQVQLTYYTGDQPTTFDRNLPFKLYSRNSIRWNQKERFASFVTPNDPAIVDFARGVAVPFGDAHQGAPLPAPIMTAWSVFSGLGTYGISYLARPNNPYDRVSLDSSTVDTLQFARETLRRKSGDCADVVALLASALESLTVTTCALDAPGHLFLMFDTGLSDRRALGFPESMLVYYAGTYWIPLEVTMIGSPFMEAWKQGADEYRRWSAQGKVQPIDIHMAWRTFEPATLQDLPPDPTLKAPTREAIETKFLPDWKALAAWRWQTSLGEAKAEAAQNPSSGAPWLGLGFLSVDYKHYSEAKEHFMKARTDPLTASAAYNGLGNIAFLEGQMEGALTHYTQAQEKDPTDARILLNITRIHLKQGHPEKASATFEKALHLDPAIKDQYPDVSALTP